MSSTVRRVAACVAVGGLALALSVGSTAADDAQKKYTISEIMKKGHAGSKSLIKGVGAQVKAGQWEEALNGAKTLKTFGEALGTLKPEQGDTASWKKLTDEYKQNTATVATAVEKKDAQAATAALGKIQKSCKGCHDVHKQ